VTKHKKGENRTLGNKPVPAPIYHHKSHID